MKELIKNQEYYELTFDKIFQVFGYISDVVLWFLENHGVMIPNSCPDNCQSLFSGENH
jgi:hypothetical protein